MIWRPAEPKDNASIIKLSRDPMGGKVQLIWGLEKIQAPTGCDNFKAYVIEDSGLIQASAFSWRWPCGSLYLSGLRISPKFNKRPPANIWKQAFSDFLQDGNIAWTCIGNENTLARRLLEKDINWLPHYVPAQNIRTWFVPIQREMASLPPKVEIERLLNLQNADWRYAAISSGSGLSYQLGRFMHRIGMRGIPTSGQRMQLAYFNPDVNAPIKELREGLKQVSGYDGIVVCLPAESQASEHWMRIAPKLSWTWNSTLYRVSWNDEPISPDIPKWKGIWL